VADVFAVAKGAGVAPEEAMGVLGLFNAANVAANRGKKIAAGDYAPSFELPMARKDVRLMIETAGVLPLAMLPGFAARMDALLAAGYGGYDFSVIARHEVG
jgi:3-hydroxyisobutyrate dehydrogenase-like beta-hydroxyacid dehydrogenase